MNIIFPSLLMSFLQIAAAEDPFGAFLYPAQTGLTFYQGDTIIVSYISNYPSTSLMLWCRENGDGGVVEVSRTQPATPFNGTQQIYINFSKTSNSCWFEIHDESREKVGKNSLIFALSAESRIRTTIGLQSTTVSTADITPTKTTTETSSTMKTAVNSSSDSVSSENGLSNGSKIGIGVGVSFGALAILGCAGLLWRRQNKKRQKKCEASSLLKDDIPEQTFQHNRLRSELPQLDGGQEPRELEG